VKGTRTASGLSIGQFKELTAAVLEGIPPNLLADMAQWHIEHKGKLHQWLKVGLNAYLTGVDFSADDVTRKLGVLLGIGVTQFAPEVRRRLSGEGYQFVRIPGGLTLTDVGAFPQQSYRISWFPHPDKIEELELRPTLAREVAWRPGDPLIPLSTPQVSHYFLNFEEQQELVAEHSRKLQRQFGPGVDVVLPSAEEVAYLILQRDLAFWATWTINKCGKERRERVIIGPSNFNGLYVWSRPLGKIRADDATRRVGILQIVVPASGS